MRIVYGLAWIAASFLSNACSPWTYDDTHPELALLEELIKDTTTFRPLSESSVNTIVLKDDLLFTAQSLDEMQNRYRIADLQGNVKLEWEADNTSYYYFDSLGNVYAQQKKFPHRDFAHPTAFELINVEDSISLRRDEVYARPNPLGDQQLAAYRATLMQRYDLQDCSPHEVAYSECNFTSWQPRRLLIVGQPNWMNYAKTFEPVATLDAPTEYGYRVSGGHFAIPSQAYRYYYVLPNGLKFKTDYSQAPTFTTVEGQIILNAWGLNFLLQK